MKTTISKIAKRAALSLVLGLVLAAPQFVKAHEGEMKMSQQKMPAAFERLKQLVGTWTGTMDMGGKQMDYTVSYELTAGGSAILEREFVGTPHEMISVYYPEGKNVVVTHYCMLGNQPHMSLTKSSGNTLSFVMQGSAMAGMSPNEAHMHSLTLTQIDANHLKAEWTEYEKGKKNHVTVMDLTRKS